MDDLQKEELDNAAVFWVKNFPVFSGVMREHRNSTPEIIHNAIHVEKRSVFSGSTLMTCFSHTK